MNNELMRKHSRSSYNNFKIPHTPAATPFKVEVEYDRYACSYTEYFLITDNLLSHQHFIHENKPTPLLKYLDIDYNIIHTTYSVFSHKIYFSPMSIHNQYQLFDNSELYKSLVIGSDDIINRDNFPIIGWP